MTVAVANAKGGVGKTSLVANLSGMAARSGLRTLAVDLDPQGNLANDLGYKDRTDFGRSLARLFRGVDEPTTVSEVRPGLDVWAGGPHLSQAVIGALIPKTAHPLSEAVDALGDRYDVVFVDCPPALGPLVDAGLLTADYLIVPIRADHASLDGLGMISDRFRQARDENPALELLGITIFDVSRAATVLAEEVAQAVRQGFAGIDLRILPAVRRSERAAFEMRASGRLAHEYAEAAPSNEAAVNLAHDYESLAAPILAAARKLAESRRRSRPARPRVAGAEAALSYEPSAFRARGG